MTVRGLDLFDRLGVEQERHDADEGNAFFARPGLFVGIARHDDLAEAIVHVREREEFLLALVLVGNLPRRLDVDAFGIAMVLFLLDEATCFKATRVHHKLLGVCDCGQNALKFMAFANKVKASMSKVFNSVYQREAA